jgi:pimeloyl-ACP methyl ester carboxylesterase
MIAGSETLRFDVRGGVIEARCAGQGPTVVLLHGLLVNGHVWDPLIPLLADGARLVMPDLPLGGHRRPLDDDADCSLSAHAERVIEIARRLPGPITLVGSDTGGAVAQIAVASAPGVFDRLVLLPSDAFENCPPRLLAPLCLAARIPGVLALIVHALRAGVVTRLVMKLVARASLARAVLDRLLGDLRVNRGIRRDLTKLLRHLRPRATLEAAAQLDRFRGAALVIWSERDPLFPAEHGRRLAERLAHARLEIVSGTRAFISLDQPERLARLLRDFIPRRAT